MKILHLDFDDLESPTAGGQAVRTFEINRRLAKKGHEITVVTLNYPNAKTRIKEGIRYERAGAKKYPWNFLTYFASVPAILWSHKYDLVIEDNNSPFTFALSPLYTQKPVISQVQSFYAKESSKKYHLPFWIVEKYGIKLYRNFLVLTKNMADKIHALNKKARIEIIPNGLSTVPDLSVPQDKHNNGDYLLFLGRIDFYYKGLDYLLEVAKILLRKAPGLKIKIAGEGRDREKLNHRITAENIKNIDYVGKIAGPQKEKLLRECAMLVLPSRFEIFPFTILEAAAYGKPTICFDIENLRENIACGIGIAVPAFKIEKFAAAIIELNSNSSERARLGQNAHDWAKKHLWEDVAAKQEAFYFSCLK